MVLYEALQACKSHPTADELFRMVNPDTVGLSRATVYNTLEALCRVGLARRLAVTNGSCRYDADISDHLHVRMTDGAEIRDVPDGLGRRLVAGLPKSIVAQIEDAMGIRVEGVTIQLLARNAGCPSAGAVTSC